MEEIPWVLDRNNEPVSEMELSESEATLVAAERLREVRNTEEQIDDTVSQLPDSPQRDELEASIASQRNYIHEVGRDIWNGIHDVTGEKLPTEILALPDVLQKLLEKILNFLWLRESSQDVFEQREMPENTERDQETVTETLEDTPVDEYWYSIAQSTQFEWFDFELTHNSQGHAFVIDASTGSIVSGKHAQQSAREVYVEHEGKRYIPYPHNNIFFPESPVQTAHIELWWNLYKWWIWMLKSYLAVHHGELAYMLEQHQENPEWIRNKDFGKLFGLGLLGWAFLDCESGGGDTSHAYLLSCLEKLQQAYPWLLNISSELFWDITSLKDNMQTIKQSFDSVLQHTF